MSADIRLKTAAIERLEASLSDTERLYEQREEQLKQRMPDGHNHSDGTIQRLEMAIAERDETIRSLAAKATAAERQHQQMKQLMAQMGDKHSELETELTTVRKDKIDLGQNLHKAEAALEILKQSLEDTKKDSNSLAEQQRMKIEELQTQLSVLQTTAAKNDKADKASDQLRVYASRVAALQEDNKQMMLQIDELRTRNIELTNEKVQLLQQSSPNAAVDSKLEVSVSLTDASTETVDIKDPSVSVPETNELRSQMASLQKDKEFLITELNKERKLTILLTGILIASQITQIYTHFF